MAREPNNRKVIRDFQGMVEADPMDLPEGASQVQVNLAVRTLGVLETRRGFRFAEYDSVTLITSLD